MCCDLSKNHRMQRLLLVLFALAAIPLHAADLNQHLFLSLSGDNRVDNFLMLPGTGDLIHKQTVEIPGQAGPICESPGKYRLYVANRLRSEGKGWKNAIATLKLETSGKLTLLHNAEIEDYPSYIRTDATGRFLFGSHYGEGKVSCWEISNGLCTGKLVDHELPGEKAHSVEISRRNNHVFVPHTGANKVSQFLFDPKTGQLTPNDPASVAGPANDRNFHEPRHILFHPVLDYVYTSNERGGGISTWDYDPNHGTLKLVQTLPTLPKDFDWTAAAADIRITPNGKFVYVSNRDNTDRKAMTGKDTITGFSINEKNGRLKQVGRTPTVHGPRSFTIDETGTFMYVAGQYSSQLATYRIDPGKGTLTLLKTYRTGANPLWAKAMYLPKP